MLAFDIFSQDKELKTTYDRASQAMQRIVALAERNGVKKEDVSSGILTVTPYYGGDRKKRTKSFLVQGHIVLKVHDFSKLGALMEESVNEITDFRSLTYSLADEEAAKQHAVAEAMRRAVGRANAALEQKGQKIGALRFASLDVKQIVGVVRLETSMIETVDITSGVLGKARAALPPPPSPMPRPQKITVSATVQCAFQIQ
ncbi:MAG TPA: SIMPL domain-containing protein [Candidatus Dormibacteraeota bacterium]|nr:SIMPL domain-containing protein [Candidatus Dormibacteraeota bacterium]